MTSRPCKPDADTKRLWQMLMPGVAMPSCGTGDSADAAENETPVPPAHEPKNANDKN